MFVLFIIGKLSKDIVRIVKWYPHPIREDLRILRMLPQSTSNILHCRLAIMSLLYFVTNKVWLSMYLYCQT